MTVDKELIEHLFALFFCWEYPSFLSFAKEHFLSDFHIGRTKYCSALLVNTLLALGYRFTSPETVGQSVISDSTIGDQVFVEARRLLLGETTPSLTTIQALGMMSIRETNCGRVSASWYYSGESMHMAIEMGLHADTLNEDDLQTDEQEVRAITF